MDVYGLVDGKQIHGNISTLQSAMLCSLQKVATLGME